MTDLHRWRHPAVLDDMFLYHLARLQAAAGSRVVRLCEGRYGITPVSYTHLRAHETGSYFVCRLLLEKKKHRMPSSA